eukprot:6488066-Amphidinium_carterae.1
MSVSPQQVAEIVDRIQRLEAHVQALQQEVVRQDGAMQQMQAEMATRTQQAGGSRMDPLKLARPPTFSGEEHLFEDWCFKLKTFIAQDSLTTASGMTAMEGRADAPDYTLYDDSKKRDSASLFFRLVALTEKGALSIVRQIEPQDGYEAWRRLCARYAPRTVGKNLTRLTQILEYSCGEDERAMLDKIASWERLIQEHEQVSGERVADSVKCAIIQRKMPPTLRTHLLVTSSGATDWLVMRRAIQSYLLATVTLENDPMDVGFVGKGKDKRGGKGKEGQGKGKDKRGGKDTGKDKGGKGKDKSGKGQGTSGKPSGAFEGYCGRCGLWGHKQRDCRKPKAVAAVTETGEGATGAEDVAGVFPGDDADEAEWIHMVSDDAMKTPKGKVTLMVDSGAGVSCCGLSDFPHVELDETSPERPCRGADGRRLKSYGFKWVVLLLTSGLCMQVRFTVLDVVRPILSVSSITMAGWSLQVSASRAELIHGRQRLELRREGGLFLMTAAYMASNMGAAQASPQSEMWLHPVEGEIERAFDTGLEEMGDMADLEREDRELPSAAEMPGPPSVTEEQRRHHELTHIPYQRWCTHCVRGKGREDAHRTKEALEASGPPIVQADFTFYTDGEVQVPVLGAIDSVYHRGMSVWLTHKGVVDDYATKCLQSFLQSLGFARGIVQVDAENSAVAVAKKAIENLEGWHWRHTPVNSKQSNGMVERFHAEIQGAFRVNRCCLEARYGFQLASHHPCLPWLLRHVNWLRDRFAVSRDDHQTPLQRQLMRSYERQLVRFGEVILWKDAHKQRFKFEAHWGWGVYLGRAAHSEEHLVGTSVGTIRCRTVRRVPPEDQHNSQQLLSMRGLPWDFKAALATPTPSGAARSAVPATPPV